MGVNKPKELGLTRSYRASVAINVALIVLLGGVLAFLVVFGVRRASYVTPLRFDVTADQRYALDPLAMQLLDQLESDLEVTFVCGYDRGVIERVLDSSGNPRGDLLEHYYQPIFRRAMRRVSAVLREWDARSPKIRWRVLWQATDPALIETIAREQGRPVENLLNRVILEMGGRRREIALQQLAPDMQWGYFARIPGQQDVLPTLPRQWRVHEEMTANLRSLTEGKTTKIGIVTEVGGLYEPRSRDHWDLITTVTRDAGFELVPLPASGLDRVPEEVAAVLLLVPEKQLSARATAALIDFEAQRGGRLMLVPSPISEAPITRLLEPYGLALRPGVITDRRLSNSLRGVAHALDSDRLYQGSHPIVSGLTESGIRCFSGLTRPIEMLPDHAPGATRTALLGAGRDARVLPVRENASGQGYRVANDQAAQALRYRPGFGFALERPSGIANEQARVVVFSGQGIVNPAELWLASVYSNRDLFLNGVRWLTDRDSTIGLTPRDAVRSRLVDPRRLEGPFQLVGVVLLPGLALIAGLLVWWSRRSA